MANNYLQLSATLDVGTKEDVAKAMDIYNKAMEKAEDEDEELVYDFDVEKDDGTELWFYSDEFCNLDSLIAFVIKLGQELKLKGKWGFTWAETCSKMRVDEFCGGAAVIDLETGHNEFINSAFWLEEKLQGKESKENFE